nr:MAG TPA: LexA-like protein [Caudoviricetes sp.]
MDSIKERMLAFIAYKGLNNKQFEELCGLGNGFVSKIGDAIRTPKLELISNTFKDLNRDWLVRGVGDMIIKDDSGKRVENRNKVIKYYPSVSGSMGGVEFLDSPEENSVDMIVPGFSECKFAINAYGDSMYPVIKSGQIVLLMEWRENFIEWGRIYLVVTKNGYRTIKYLKPSKESGSISCESENKENSPSFDVKLEDIQKLFLVKGWVCREVI